MHGTSSELTRLVNHVNNVVLVLSIAFELIFVTTFYTYGTYVYPSAVISIVFVTAHRNCCLYLACGLVMSEASTLRVEPARDQRSRAVEEVRWMRWAQHQKEQVRIGKPWFGERSFLFCQAFYPSKNPRAQKKCRKTWYMLPTCWWRHTHTHTHKMCSSQIIGVIMSHFLSCHNFCKIVSLHRVENPLLTVITVTSMIDIWLMNLSKKKSSAPEFVLSFSAMLGKLVRLAEALLTFVPALRTILFIAFPVTPHFA